MKLIPLLEVQSQLKAGAPLPFSIRDSEGKLLLARGHMVDDDAVRSILLERGASVDMEEVHPQRRGEAIAPPSENIPGKWHQLQTRATVALRPPHGEDLIDRVKDLGTQMLALVERDTDLVLYLTLRAARDPGVQYGVLHAMQVAVVCALLARRMGWPPERQASVVGAALTMNLSIIELQSRLAGSSQPLTQAQREVMDAHPQAGAEILRKAGLDDAEWLRAVELHHAPPAGTEPQPEADETTRLLRLVDAYCTRITDRPDTIIASPALAAKDLFAQHAKDPFALHLVKELGLYPPGCFVRTASGETAVVLRRGASANAPLVAALTNKRGDALQTPIRRDTGLLADHAIAAVVPDKEVKVRVPAMQLYG
jgi:hypothetical protein